MRPLATGLDISDFVAQLDECDDLWNAVGFRNIPAKSPHRDADDIWLRARPTEEFDPANPLAFLDPHVPVWYPCSHRVPAVFVLGRQIVNLLTDGWNPDPIGTVLVTRIPAGKCVHWHTDNGWNQAYYDTKVAVSLRSNKEQYFCFGRAGIMREAVITEPGDAFCFWNEWPHMVVNDSDDDRLTLIFSIRTKRS